MDAIKTIKRMKSIKLKAEEHLRENNITQYEYKSYIEGADFGANYVLECFESILPFVAKKGIIYGKIKDTIEQLKK